MSESYPPHQTCVWKGRGDMKSSSQLENISHTNHKVEARENGGRGREGGVGKWGGVGEWRGGEEWGMGRSGEGTGVRVS